MLLSRISQRNGTEVGILGTVSPGNSAALVVCRLLWKHLRSSLCRCTRARWCRVPPKCVNQASVRGELRRFQANLCCRGIGEHALQDCSEEYCCKVLGLSLQYLLDAGTSAVTVPWLGYVSSGKFSQKKDCKGVRMNQNAVYLTPVLPASTEAQRSCAPPVSQAALAAATQPGHQPWVANDGEAVPTELMWCVPTVPLWPAIPPGVEGGFQDTPFATHAGDRINRCFDILDSCMSVATGACAARVAQLCLPGYQERLAESDGLGISIPRCLDEVLFLDEDAHSI